MKHTNAKIIAVFLILISLISCSKDDEIIQEEAVNDKVNELIEFKIDGKTYKSINNGTGLTLLGTNYQGSASISVKNGNIAEFFYDLKYIFTESGQLLSFELEETKYNAGNNILKIFKTPTYKPLNSFQINKFEINETSKKITIEFSGILNSTTNSQESRVIEGKIFHSFDAMSPWGRDYCYIKSNNSTSNYLSSYFQVLNNGTGNQNIDYVSGDGRNISIQLNQPLTNLMNLSFDENSTNNKVSYRKALSPYIINDSYLGSLHSQQQWQNFRTSGNLVVTNIYNGTKPGGGIHIKGIINLTVKDQNNNIIEIMELEFVTNN